LSTPPPPGPTAWPWVRPSAGPNWCATPGRPAPSGAAATFSSAASGRTARTADPEKCSWTSQAASELTSTWRVSMIRELIHCAGI
ncbi:hypothetical protein FHG87_025737, partial [Trinorchestia longiramus]